MTFPFSTENETAVLDRANVIFERMRALQEQGQTGGALVTLLDAGDLDALRHAAGVMVAILAIGMECEMDDETEEQLRESLAGLYPMIEGVSIHLASKDGK